MIASRYVWQSTLDSANNFYHLQWYFIYVPIVLSTYWFIKLAPLYSVSNALNFRNLILFSADLRATQKGEAARLDQKRSTPSIVSDAAHFNTVNSPTNTVHRCLSDTCIFLLTPLDLPNVFGAMSISLSKEIKIASWNTRTMSRGNDGRQRNLYRRSLRCAPVPCRREFIAV